MMVMAVMIMVVVISILTGACDVDSDAMMLMIDNVDTDSLKQEFQMC